MPKALVLRCEVNDGRVSASVARTIRGVLPLYNGRTVQITVSSPKRSTQANAYYWACVVPEVQRVMVEAGYAMTADDVHRWLKERFLDRTPYETPTGPAVRLRSTTDLDSTEFYEYVEKIRTDELLLSLGCVVPEPESSYRSYKLAEAA